MSLTHRAAGVCTLLLLAGAATAQEWVPYYSNTFQSGALGPEWTGGREISYDNDLTTYNGRYSDTSETVLKLKAVKPPEDNNGGIGGGSGGGSGGGGSGGSGGGAGAPKSIEYAVIFDFYAIDSWDGDLGPFGPDRMTVKVNGVEFFNETISNVHDYQSFRAPDVGPTHLGYNPAFKDSIYRDIEVPFTVDASATTVSIKFRGYVLQQMADESWGIDNVRVLYRVVPAPASAGLLGMGLVGLARRRR